MNPPRMLGTGALAQGVPTRNSYPELQPHLDAARLAEERARREGLPDRHWPLAWDIVVNSRSLVPGLPPRFIADRIVEIRRAISTLNVAVFGRCSECRRPWPQSYHPLECPACKRGHLIPPAWRVNATQP